MDNEDKAQLQNEVPQIAQDCEPILPLAEDTEITQVTEITEAGGAEEPVSEQIKETTEAAAAAADTTHMQLNEEPVNQSSVASLLETGVAEEEKEEEAKATEQLKEASQETDLPDPSVTAPAVSETLEADKDVTLILPDATPLPVSDANPVTETTEETKDAEPNYEEQNINMAVEFSRAESENESACLKPDTKLAEVKAEEPGFQDTSVAAEDKGTEPAKEEIKEFEFPDSSSAPAAAPVLQAELTPECKPSEAAAVTEVHSGKEKTSDQLKVDKENASTVLFAETVDTQTEVTEVLPEKKKKRALGDHLAEEKANDSVNANKQASVEKCEVQLPQVEQMANAAALNTTDDTPLLVNTTDDTKTEADEKKEENEKVIENAAPTGEATVTEVAQEREGDKVAEKEPVTAGEAGKEEVVSKLTSRGPNNILSKVKHQIVKVKKAIVRRSPSSKNMKVEIKGDIKVN